MKKTVSLFLICIMMFTYMLDYVPRVSADTTMEVTNVALQAIASTTAGTSQNTIHGINDNNMEIGWASGRNPTMPAYVELDWGSKLVTTSRISLSGNFGPSQGIKTIDIEYFDGGTWKLAKSDITLVWNKNEQAAETLDIDILEITASKIRLKVKSAATVWGHYTIMELRVWGNIELTANSVAESIKSIASPARGQSKIKLPDVPQGFEVRIQSSDREDIIGLDGTIAPLTNDEKISLVLEVMKLSDQTKAYTVALQVKVLVKPADDYMIKTPIEDTTSIIKNPAMGWMLYVEEFGGPGNAMTGMTAEEYWETVDPHRESANILYIRVPWSRMEPTEGHYAWNEDENYKKYVQGALDRNIRLAFRVVIDSQDVHMQATPQFVFDAGARGVGTASNSNFKSPIVTDLVFRAKFENFVKAFSKEYDDPSIVDFVDAGGMGYWGEMYTFSHSMTKAEKDDTFKWIVNLYADKFKHVLLGQQDASSFDMALQDWAYKEKGFILRRDSYGSPVYFDQTQKDRIVARWPDVPVFAENCYQNFVSRASSCDGKNKPIHDMLTRVVNDALYTHANTLDLRHPEDVIEFATNNADLVEKFALQGGYRFVLNDVSYPAVMDSNKSYKIYHSWKNTGVGKLPNDLLNWGYKYKVAFALLDPDTQQPVKMMIDDAEPSDWIKGERYSYSGSLQLDGVPDGNYELAVAIVDTTKDNTPAIKLAVKDVMTDTGWYKISDVKTFSIDTTKLSKAIKVAQSVYDLAIEGTKPGQYPLGTKAKLQEAINIATVVLDSETVTQEEIDLAITALNTAVNELKANGEVIPGGPITELSGPVTVRDGQPFEMEFGLKSVTDSVYALDLTIEYDSDVMSFVSVTSMQEGIKLLTTKDTLGQVRMIVISEGSAFAITGDMKLLKLSFESKAVSQTTNGIIKVSKALMGNNLGLESEGVSSSFTIQVTTAGIPGDVNQDGKVTIGDLALVAANYGKDSNSADWQQVKRTDVTKDGFINIDDLALVARAILE
ncbi:dockerin type I domain-containing protein [Paenibacillus antarcticus]|uniref:Dockerin domain-containing protein n=1 Tax=Paenibacillus antarcticus TaxID=253703 RepID=A0A162KBZ2_9BACL|nr:DUF4832 domain-containing protein [Paenibacillus antarcticus]OAB43538.1 hypothetical protein PBAT_17915 [Paenibacillus antarcticus]